MHSQELALLEAIHAHPADDGPRLVYADWLEEHGRCDLAEFIRIQIERAERDPYDPIQKLLAHRERELIEGHANDWVSPALRAFLARELPVDEPPAEPLDPNRTKQFATDSRWQFRRGFPWVEVSVGQFLSNAPLIIDSAPFVQVHIGADSVYELMRWAQAQGSARPRREAFRDLAASPLLPTGVGLTLIEKSDWESLVHLRPGVRVSALHVREAGSRRWHLRELHRPAFERLDELSLRQTNLGDSAVPELAAWSGLEHVRTLDLRSNKLTAAGIDNLMSGTMPTRLRTLDLSDNPLGDTGAEYLARWPGLATVRELRLAGCGLTAAGASALAHSPHLRSLKQLQVRRNSLAGGGVSALLREPGWLERLAMLDLCGNHIGPDGADELTQGADLLPGLRRLCLSLDRDDLGNKDVEEVTQVYGDRLKLDWFQPPRIE